MDPQPTLRSTDEHSGGSTSDLNYNEEDLLLRNREEYPAEDHSLTALQKPTHFLSVGCGSIAPRPPLQRDEAAVRAALSLKWKQGPVEGAVNRLKLIKRSRYGRAKFDLLRTRVLCVA